MALFSTAILRDEIANRPAASAGTTGRLFISTDESKIYRDNGSTWDEIVINASASSGFDTFTLNDGSELTIDTAAVTATHARHTIDTESDAASDDLETISGLSAGEFCIISANNAARTVVVKHGVDNITSLTGEDITLDDVDLDVLCYGRASDVLAIPLFGLVTVDATQTLTNKTYQAANETVEALGNQTGSIALDYANGAMQTLTLTGNTTITAINNPPANGGTLSLLITQDGSGGHTLAFPASVKWTGGTDPTITATASAIDLVSLITFDGGTTWYGSYGQDYS